MAAKVCQGGEKRKGWKVVERGRRAFSSSQSQKNPNVSGGCDCKQKGREPLDYEGGLARNDPVSAGSSGGGPANSKVLQRCKKRLVYQEKVDALGGAWPTQGAIRRGNLCLTLPEEPEEAWRKMTKKDF